MMEDLEDDTVCKVMEMLNFSVTSTENPKEPSQKNGSTPFNEQQNKENEINNGTGFQDNWHQQPQYQQSHVRSPCDIVKERELAYQCMMLGTDLFIAREENVTSSKRLTDVIRENEILKEDLCKVKYEKAKLSKRLSDASEENKILGKELCKVKEEKAKLSKKLSEAHASLKNEKPKWEAKRKLIQAEARLLKQECFSTEFQCAVQTFLSALAKVVKKDGEKLDLESEKIEILIKLLMEISGKVPVYVLKDWDEIKAVFKKLNMLFSSSDTVSTSTTGSLPKSAENEKQSSPNTPTEVSTTTSSPPIKDSEGESENGNNDNNNKDDTSAAMDNDNNDDILILEENVSTSRPSVVVTRTTVPKTPAAASANHSNTCVFCGAKYTDSKLLIEHLAVIHKGCLLCKISFANQEMLNRHIQFTHQYWQPGSQQVPANIPVSKPLTMPPSPNIDGRPPPSTVTGEPSKTQSQTNNIRLPTFPSLCPLSKRPKHGMVSSDPKDVSNKCFCGYSFMSKKELCVHIMYSNNARSSS